MEQRIAGRQRSLTALADSLIPARAGIAWRHIRNSKIRGPKYAGIIFDLIEAGPAYFYDRHPSRVGQVR
jgi:hypothetical protein